MSDTPCPCGSGATFTACCGPILAGARPAPTAEALMRARYSAHLRRDAAFVNATQRLPGARRASAADLARVRWLGLRVLAVEGGGPDDETGIVEFSATHAGPSGLGQHHERSTFRRDAEGAWVYVAGETPNQPAPAPARSQHAPQPRPGRNQPCPCGSGKKYKRCCGTPGGRKER